MRVVCVDADLWMVPLLDVLEPSLYPSFFVIFLSMYVTVLTSPAALILRAAIEIFF